MQPDMTGASRPRNSTACPRASRAASLRLTASAGSDASPASTGSRNEPSAPGRSGHFGAGGGLLQRVDAHCIVLAERSDQGAAKLHHMTVAAERAAHVAGDGADIGALAALGLEHRTIRVGALGGFDEVEAMDVDRARFKLDDLALARQIVGPLALDLHRREPRRHLRDGAGEARQERANRRRRRPLRTGATTRPSASSVSRSSPQRTVKR